MTEGDGTRLRVALAALDELLEISEREMGLSQLRYEVAGAGGLSNRTGPTTVAELAPAVGLTNGGTVRRPDGLSVDRGLINGFAKEGARTQPRRDWGLALLRPRARRDRRVHEALARMASLPLPVTTDGAGAELALRAPGSS